jgi:glycerol-3-phosphate acyltransferase PlsX
MNTYESKQKQLFKPQAEIYAMLSDLTQLEKYAAAVPAEHKDKIKDLKHKFDSSEHGGAPLLGISKPVIKAHGSSDAKAIMNAVRQAIHFVETGINNDIAKFAEDYDDKKLLADAERLYGN